MSSKVTRSNLPSVGSTVYSGNWTNSDGTPRRYKVTSVKTWKSRRMADRFRIGLKHGLYTYDEFTDSTSSDYVLFTAESEALDHIKG